MVIAGVQTGGPIFFIYLTNWGLISFNIYLVIAALSTTTKFLTVHVICRQRYGEAELGRVQSDSYFLRSPSGCCGYGDNKLTWYQMIHWFFFNIGNMQAFGILILYWGILYRGGPVSPSSFHTHLINGLVSIVDLWVSGLPVNIFHFVWIMIYAVLYSIFTGIYFVISGRSVYTVLDYENDLVSAIGLVVGLILAFLPLVHIVVFYLQYVIRYLIIRQCFGRNRDAPLSPEQ